MPADQPLPAHLGGPPLRGIVGEDESLSGTGGDRGLGGTLGQLGLALLELPLHPVPLVIRPLVAQLQTSGNGSNKLPRGFAMAGAQKEEVLAVLTALVEKGQVPDLFGPGWQAVQLQQSQQPQQQSQGSAPFLNLTDRVGASRKYDRFSRRDVELAAQGLAEGFHCWKPSGSLPSKQPSSQSPAWRGLVLVERVRKTPPSGVDIWIEARQEIPEEEGFFILTDYAAGKTVVVNDGAAVTQQMEKLQAGEQFRLEPVPPIPAEGLLLAAVNCVNNPEGDGILLVAIDTDTPFLSISPAPGGGRQSPVLFALIGARGRPLLLLGLHPAGLLRVGRRQLHRLPARRTSTIATTTTGPRRRWRRCKAPRRRGTGMPPTSPAGVFPAFTTFHASWRFWKGMASSISGVSMPQRMAPSTPMALPWRMLWRT